MPLIDASELGVPTLAPLGSTPIGDAGTAGRDTPSADPQPSDPADAMLRHGAWIVDNWLRTGAVMGAAFRQGNGVASALTSSTFGVDNSNDDAHNPWDAIKGTKYEPYWSSFSGSMNARYTDALKMQIDKESADRQALDAAGWRGHVAMLAAGMLDPVILVPGLDAAQGAKGVWTIGRAALRGAVDFGAMTLAQEAELHASQVTRTGKESAINVGAGVILGSLLGGGAKAIFGNPAEVESAVRAADNLARNEGTPTVEQIVSANSVGAEATRTFTNAEMTVAGGAAERVASALHSMNPILRSNYRAAPSARQWTNSVLENTLYQTMHDEGRTLGPAVETAARAEVDRRLAAAAKEHETIYSEMRKSGVSMSRPDFEEAVGRAMRTRDEGRNDFITKAAQTWRREVFEPLKRNAVELGLLPEDVSVGTASSYFSRIINREAVSAQEHAFKGVHEAYYLPIIEQEYHAGADALRRRTAALDRDIGYLKMGVDEKLKASADLRAEGDALDAANPYAVDAMSQVSDLRSAMKKANASGDRPAAGAARQQILDIMRDPSVQAYAEARADIRHRKRYVGASYGGLASRFDRAVQTMADIEEANTKSLNRLVDKGRRFEREAQRLDPEKYQERLDDLRSSFAQVAERADRSLERISQQIEKLREDGSGSAALAGKLEESVKAERVAAQRLHSISARIERLENFDPVGTLQEVRAAVDEAVQQVNRLSLKRGERIGQLRAKLESLDPKKVDAHIRELEAAKADAAKKFFDKWEGERGGLSVDPFDPKAKPDFSAMARDIADDLFDSYMGRKHGPAQHPEYHVPITRGPLKDRTNHIPDALIEPWLESNIKYVGSEYARTMAAEIELTRKLGRADGRDQRVAIQQQYDDLRRAVAESKTDKEAFAAIGREPSVTTKLNDFLSLKSSIPVRERLNDWLIKDEKGALEDFDAAIALVRGTYKQDLNSGNLARITRGLMHFNYLRMMGGFISANASELYRPAMVHGLMNYMRDGIAPLIKSIPEILRGVEGPMSRAFHELNLAGIGGERFTHGRLATFGEIGDPFARGNAIERLLQNGSTIATKWNGLTHFTDFEKMLAGMTTQARIIRAVEKGSDRRYLAMLGIDDAMANRIGESLAKHKADTGGVVVANTEKWADPVAARVFRLAVNKDVNTVIPHRGLGDVPLALNTPVGKLVGQFRTFNLAANQRVLLRGLQEGKARFVSGLIGATSIGMLAATVTAWRQGREYFDKWHKAVSENPMKLVAEGLDKAGVFTLAFEAANTLEPFSVLATGRRINPIKTPIELLGGGAPEKTNNWGSPTLRALGPSGRTLDNLASAAGFGINSATGSATKAQRRAAAGMMPFSSYYGMRELLQALQGDSPYLH